MDWAQYELGQKAESMLSVINRAIYEYCWKFHQYNPTGYQRGETVCPNCIDAFEKHFGEEYRLLDKEYPSPSRWKIGVHEWMTDEEWEAFKAKTAAEAPTPTREIGSSNKYK